MKTFLFTSLSMATGSQIAEPQVRQRRDSTPLVRFNWVPVRHRPRYRYRYRCGHWAKAKAIARSREKLVCRPSDLGDFHVKRWLSAIGKRLTGGPPRPWLELFYSVLFWARFQVTGLVYGLRQEMTVAKWILDQNRISEQLICIRNFALCS